MNMLFKIKVCFSFLFLLVGSILILQNSLLDVYFLKRYLKVNKTVFTLHILASSNTTLLDNLFSYLNYQVMNKDKMDIKIHVNTSHTNYSEIRNIINEFQWTHGKKEIITSHTLDIWDQDNNIHNFVMLKDYVILYPEWYQELKHIWMGYCNKSYVGGINWSTKSSIITNVTFISEQSYEAYSPNPFYWNMYLRWFMVNLTRIKKYKDNPKWDTLIQNFEIFCKQHKLVTIYPNQNITSKKSNIQSIQNSANRNLVQYILINESNNLIGYKDVISCLRKARTNTDYLSDTRNRIEFVSSPNGSPNFKWYGNKFSDAYLPQEEILAGLLPKKSVLFVLQPATSLDISLCIELAEVTNATVHLITYLTNGESNLVHSSDEIYLQLNRKFNTMVLQLNNVKIYHHEFNSNGSESLLIENKTVTFISAVMQTLHQPHMDYIKIDMDKTNLNFLHNLFELKLFPIIISLNFGLNGIIQNSKILQDFKDMGYEIYFHPEVPSQICLILNGWTINPIIQKAKQISMKFGFVNVQFLNEAYVDITKSWICNVQSISGVLPSTVFVTTDTFSYEQLSYLNKANVVLVNYKTAGDLTYGKASYFSFIYFRTKIISDLLSNDIAIWLTESDAVWFSSPFDDMENSAHVILINNEGPSESVVSGGMIFLRPTKHVKHAWNQLLNWEIHNNKGSDEMPMLQELMEDKHIQKLWLPDLEYVSGLWYSQPKLRSGKEKVIQNNFIEGNAAKIARAKKFNHWFLDEAGNCID